MIPLLSVRPKVMSAESVGANNMTLADDRALLDVSVTTAFMDTRPDWAYPLYEIKQKRRITSRDALIGQKGQEFDCALFTDEEMDETVAS